MDRSPENPINIREGLIIRKHTSAEKPPLPEVFLDIQLPLSGLGVVIPIERAHRRTPGLPRRIPNISGQQSLRFDQ